LKKEKFSNQDLSRFRAIFKTIVPLQVPINSLYALRFMSTWKEFADHRKGHS